MRYVFDGSYAGFLCCVFESFERKEKNVNPVPNDQFQPGIFADSREIVTTLEKATRVSKGLQQHCGKAAANFYKAFLSEDTTGWQAIFNIITTIFREGDAILGNYGNTDVLYFSQTLTKVNRERHRMQAFIRFQKTTDGMYVSVVEPDFNVLPLLSDFFKKRYADQPWLIYDAKRKYGLLYNKTSVCEVQLSPAEKNALITHTVIELDEKEEAFSQLWKTYYKSTNIIARKNMKLHLQHVPRRYWKYLTEKQ